MAATTTKNITKASAALENRIKNTEKNLKAKMAKAGVAEFKSVRVMVPKSINQNDDVLTIGLNGEQFYFLRGTSVNMPEPLVEILQNTGNL